MLIRRRRVWDAPESAVTPEAAVMAHRIGRRALLAAGAGIGGAAVLAGLPAAARAAPVDPAYANAGRPITPEQAATTYNNYYEFGEQKGIWRAAQALDTDGWTIELAGLCANPRKIALADLVKQMPLQDRVYRHRCVETWAMTVPWTGFPLAALVKLADPKPEARFVGFTTIEQPKTMPGLRSPFYPWPYTEGLTMAEATNDLAFMVTGMYGHDLPKQDGAPIRVHLPWKYGFKSAKSIVKVSFLAKQPATFWQQLADNEYGFWANVNPAVPHPRWSQATETLLGTNERVPTVIWNGYGEQVAGLYTDIKGQQLFR